MDDDVNVSGALAVVHEAVTRGNTALASRDADAARRSQLEVRSMLDVLGLDPLCEQWRAPGGSTAEHAALTSLVEGMLERRSQARAAKDWATADAVRDALAGAGIAVEDSPQGVRWHVEGP
jgi:cysteine--tRNA ligase